MPGQFGVSAEIGLFSLNRFRGVKRAGSSKPRPSQKPATCRSVACPIGVRSLRVGAQRGLAAPFFLRSPFRGGKQVATGRVCLWALLVAVVLVAKRPVNLSQNLGPIRPGLLVPDQLKTLATDKAMSIRIPGSSLELDFHAESSGGSDFSKRTCQVSPSLGPLLCLVLAREAAVGASNRSPLVAWSIWIAAHQSFIKCVSLDGTEPILLSCKCRPHFRFKPRPS